MEQSPRLNRIVGIVEVLQIPSVRRVAVRTMSQNRLGSPRGERNRQGSLTPQCLPGRYVGWAGGRRLPVVGIVVYERRGRQEQASIGGLNVERQHAESVRSAVGLT